MSSYPNIHENDRWRIGFDIGGTFTDFALYDRDTRSVRLHKRLTTPHDPSDAALRGIEELVALAGISLSNVGQIVHGTTLVTNAVIERKGAKVGLITTKGFRDSLEIGREQRYDIYDLFLEFPQPLVPRDLRLEVDERTDRDGNIVTALNPAEVRDALAALSQTGVEAVAVTLLNSYRNRAHENLVGQIARADFPHLAVSLSSEVVAEIGEYERGVTTCANAYVQPLVDRYLERLRSKLLRDGFTGDLFLMHSAGGLVSLETARAFPIRLLESGPAGGALATALFGRLAGKKDVIAFDMGGTTAKACIVQDGEVEIAPMLEAGRVHRFAKGSGLPIKTPTVDLIEIGAGGGSIASIDDVGLLKVGPQSAGSDPGPACYGLGGLDATVTDANLVLGYYDPNFFLGGDMALDKQAAEDAVAKLARPLGLGTEQTAWGIHKVVVEGMAAAARVYLIEKGLDPRDYSMVGFGGAGPAHVCDVARVMGVKEVIVPPGSGAASALGFLTAPLSFELARSRPIELVPGFDAGSVSHLLDEMEIEGRERLLGAGVPHADIRFIRSADMRLVGQLQDISVPLPAHRFSPADLDDIRATFLKSYSTRYTAAFETARIEAINFRVRATGPMPQLSLTGAAGRGDVTAKQKGSRRAWFDDAYYEAMVYDRYALVAGDRLAGPAIVEEREATTIIAPGDTAVVDDALNLVIAIEASKAARERIAADTPIEDAMALIESDPISLEIMWSRLVTVTEEMWSTVCRTAFSLVISDAQDFACELLDPDGEPIAHSPRAMPVFNLALPNGVREMLKRYPSESLNPGDVLITNDPWLLAGHLFDIAIVTPVFRGDKVVGLTATVAHVTDIGGTLDPVTTREIFEEGLQIPPIKLFEAGKPNETLIRLIGQNVRGSEEVLGDIHAMVAANEIGAKRLNSFMSDYGMANLRALTAVVQARSDKAMRDAITAIPDGVYKSETVCMPKDQPVTFPLKLTVAGDTIELDFDGTPPQIKVGAFNSTLSYATAAATYPLKCILTPQVRGNAGCYRAFTVKAPEGSILNCSRTAAVSQRTRSGWYLSPTVFRALAEAVPERVQAFTGISVSPQFSSFDESGKTHSEIFFNGGGQGASAGKDGKSSLLFPTSAGNISVEMFETRTAMLVLEKSLIEDSGGPGEFRGGLGQKIRMRKLSEDGRAILVAVFPDTIEQGGLFGGMAGAHGSGRIVDRQGKPLQDMGNGKLMSLSITGDIVEICVAGGSGYGNPFARDRGAVERDLRLGHVSAAAAKRDYGFVCNDPSSP